VTNLQAPLDVVRARLAAEGLDASSWSNGPGDRYAVHAHGYDKVIVAVEGSITFVLPGSATEIELRAGDRLDLPAGVAHGAVVGGAGVECLEAHLPPGGLEPAPRHRDGYALSTTRQTGRTAST
jgi:quercetin dioxygenase-like cupin family protein